MKIIILEPEWKHIIIRWMYIQNQSQEIWWKIDIVRKLKFFIENKDTKWNYTRNKALLATSFLQKKKKSKNKSYIINQFQNKKYHELEDLEFV